MNVSARKFYESITGNDVSQREALKTIVNDWAIPTIKTGGKNRTTHMVDTRFTVEAKRAFRTAGGRRMPMPPKHVVPPPKPKVDTAADAARMGRIDPLPAQTSLISEVERKAFEALCAVLPPKLPQGYHYMTYEGPQQPDLHRLCRDVNRMQNQVDTLVTQMSRLIKLWT